MTVRIDPSSAPIGTGRTADVYEVDEHTVVKILKPGFGAGMLDSEAAKTIAARAAGIAAPEVLGRVEVDGRPALLCERVVGSSMLDLIVESPEQAQAQAAVLADLHATILTSMGDGLPSIKDHLAAKIDGTDLPTAQRRAAKDALVTLPDGRSVLHGDFHPGNVLLASNGPRIIDWGECASGNAAADVARTQLMMTPAAAAGAVPGGSELLALVTAFGEMYSARCLSLVGLSEADVSAWRLPVIAARLAEGIAEERAGLRSEVALLTS